MRSVVFGLLVSVGGALAQGFGSGFLEETIPGVPGEDYPVFAVAPETSFLCDDRIDGGYYADTEANCQAFHICVSHSPQRLTKYSFLCPNGTMFNQQYFICDWWFNVDCSVAENFYSLNAVVAAEREANTGAVAAGSDGGRREQGQQRGGGQPGDDGQDQLSSQAGSGQRFGGQGQRGGGQRGQGQRIRGQGSRVGGQRLGGQGARGASQGQPRPGQVRGGGSQRTGGGGGGGQGQRGLGGQAGLQGSESFSQNLFDDYEDPQDAYGQAGNTVGGGGFPGGQGRFPTRIGTQGSRGPAGSRGTGASGARRRPGSRRVPGIVGAGGAGPRGGQGSPSYDAGPRGGFRGSGGGRRRGSGSASADRSTFPNTESENGYGFDPGYSAPNFGSSGRGFGGADQLSTYARSSRELEVGNRQSLEQEEEEMVEDSQFILLDHADLYDTDLGETAGGSAGNAKK